MNWSSKSSLLIGFISSSCLVYTLNFDKDVRLINIDMLGILYPDCIS